MALLVGWIGGSLTGALPQWAVTAAAVIAFAAGGYTGMKGAIEEAREGTLDIDFLMIAAALGAALIGEWPEGALLLFLFTLSGALEEFAMDRTRAGHRSAGRPAPDVARVRQERRRRSTCRSSKSTSATSCWCDPASGCPWTAPSPRASSSIDQSPITGESVPVHKGVGDEVFAGTINGGGALEVEVGKLASESTLSKIITLVAEAQEDATPTQQFIDRFSQPYTYVVIGATLLAIVIPVLFLQ